MNKPIPDRLSVDQDSPDFDPEFVSAAISVTLNGEYQNRCTAYCVSEGWVMRLKEINGQPVMDGNCWLTELIKGDVQVSWKD